MREGLVSLSVEAPVAEFVDAVGRRTGEDASAVLRRLILVDPVVARPEFAVFAARLPASILALIERLDGFVRESNPRASVVFRREFFGYRREDGFRSAAGAASRSGLFLSIGPRRTGLHLALPLDPGQWTGQPGVRDLRGVGHHGVGDVGFTIADSDNLEAALKLFGEWIATTGGPPAEPHRSSVEGAPLTDT